MPIASRDIRVTRATPSGGKNPERFGIVEIGHSSIEPMTRGNRLADETSPYLLQHAHNPVDWYPWGDAALARAKHEDKPILLSIGYSACHWCHVMAHESFEDDDVARVMNEHFVCIKVDREERPDLDKVYQAAHQYLARRTGGWPLTVFIAPDDLTPFFAGTYFPKTPRHGMPGFVDLLFRVAAAYREQRGAIHEQNTRLRELLARIEENHTGADATVPDARVLEQAREELRDQYDPDHGGFGGAPKFPHPTSIEFLLRHAARPGSTPGDALEMARGSLRSMARGGLYDQIGGGFYRYSVDERWEIPHFEKMLYDNAQLLPLYADAALVMGEPFFRRVAEETGEWIMHEMQAPAGGYYSTLDADSEGHEGKYYVWSSDEIRALLKPDEFAAIERRFGLDGAPNFEGQWHLNVHADIDAIAAAVRLRDDDVRAQLDSARRRLRAARERRVRPERDEKILASWNGLMIKGMARAGRLLGRHDFIDSAARALDFARQTLWLDGGLLATAKDGRARLNAYLDDYAFLAAGVLELLQARWRTTELTFAVELARALIRRFEDTSSGGFYFTSHDHEPLLHRPKPDADEALPSGNAVAAQTLLRLGHLLGDGEFLGTAQRSIDALFPRAARYAAACCALLTALDEYLHPPQTVVLRGADDELDEWQRRLREIHSPQRLIFAVPDGAGPLPGVLAERTGGAGTIAYVCAGHVCLPPVDRFDALQERLRPE